MVVTDFEKLDQSQHYTYADYQTWEFSERVELIRGKIYRMSPAPGQQHQAVSSNLHGFIWSYLRQQNCQLFHAPFDVRLPLPLDLQIEAQMDTVVQPDLCVICDSEKLRPEGCVGAPDWIIEILSKSTASKDLNEKSDLYEAAGVREYWVVHPEEGTLLPYILGKDGKYTLARMRPYTREKQLFSFVFPELHIDLSEVFA